MKQNEIRTFKDIVDEVCHTCELDTPQFRVITMEKINEAQEKIGDILQIKVKRMTCDHDVPSIPVRYYDLLVSYGLTCGFNYKQLMRLSYEANMIWLDGLESVKRDMKEGKITVVPLDVRHITVHNEINIVRIPVYGGWLVRITGFSDMSVNDGLIGAEATATCNFVADPDHAWEIVV